MPRMKKKVQAPKPAAPAPESGPAWTFLSNHAHVLICLSREPDLRLRDVAQRVGITERGVQKIVQDLERARILTRHREGRRNKYELTLNFPLRHPVESHRTVRDLLSAVLTDSELNRIANRA